jgi:peptidoglycan/LPS O-acetylase OafA/YrhL
VPGSLLINRVGPGALRYLLALAVVFFHATRFVPIGHTAVYLFFVLSGYWMSRMYERTYRHTTNPLRTYAISRLWRIVPIYVAALGTTLIGYAIYQALTGQSPSHALESVWVPTTLARNLALVGLYDYHSKVIVPAWSLDIELRFYALLPLLARLSLHRRRVLAVAVFCGIAAACIRIWTDVSSYGIEYVIAFVAGMAFDRRSESPLFGRKQLLAANVLASIGLALPYLWQSYGSAILWHRELTWHGVNLWEAHNVVLAALLLPFVDRNVRRPSSAVDRRLGSHAYSLYLIHWGVLCIYGAHFGHAADALKATGFALYVAVSCGAAWLLERLVDRPSEALRRDWLSRRAASVAGIAAAETQPTGGV